jgi:hypothetical protein
MQAAGVDPLARLEPMASSPVFRPEYPSLFAEVAGLAERAAREQISGGYRLSLDNLATIHRDAGVARGLTPQAATEAVGVGVARALEVPS